MSSVYVDFDKTLLKKVRAEARKAKLKIPPLRAHRLSGFSNPFYEVYGPKGLLWQGTASSAYDAKASCIEKMLEKIQ
jgi:hypothetical protein